MKYVRSAKIEWFRGIKEGFIKGFEDFTIIIGRNGAGKSSILEALYLVSAWLEPNDSIRKLRKYDYLIKRRGGRGDWRNARSTLWYSMDTEKDITISLDLGGLRTDFVLNYDIGGLWLRIEGLTQELASHLSRPEIATYTLLRLSNGSSVYLARKSFTTIMELPFKHQIINWLKTHYPILIDVSKNVLLIDNYLSSRPDLVENYAWVKVLTKRLDKEIIRIVREEFEVDAEGLTYGPIGNSNVLMLQLGNTSVRIDDLGDGARLAILIMLALYASKPKLLLIEEPETKMHPKGMKVLTEAILKVSKDLGMQVVATTHSIEFVKISFEIARNLGLNTSLIHIERDENGRIITRRLSKPDLELLSDLGIDPRFLDLF